MSDTGKKITLLAVAVVLTLGIGELVLCAINYGTITPEMNFGINTKMSLDQGSFLPDKDHRLMATLLTAQLTPALAGDTDSRVPDTTALTERARGSMRTTEVQ